MVNSRIVLVLGGGCSGKSAFAEKLTLDTGLKPAFITTRADEGAHARRDDHPVINEPLALVDALTRESRIGRVVLIDSLTDWLVNVRDAERDPQIEARRLLRYLDVARYPLIIVSDEAGPLPLMKGQDECSLAQTLGRLNQAVAASASDVCLVTAGLPLWLKGGGSR